MFGLGKFKTIRSVCTQLVAVWVCLVLWHAIDAKVAATGTAVSEEHETTFTYQTQQLIAGLITRF
eukprot:1524963-Amphidinium_carterae.1